MTIEAELLALTTEDGFIQPRAAMNWARNNPESELHGQLEWDDSKAADEYRLHQVRRLISIHIRDDEGRRTTISLVQDRRADGGYRPINRVLQNAELRAMALRQALRELKRWEQRYQHIKELAGVFEAAARVEASIGDIEAA